MPLKYVCDGCGKESTGGTFDHEGNPVKPKDWLQHRNPGSTKYACSFACVGKVTEEQLPPPMLPTLQ